MFTFEKKEYDEKKLEGKGKVAFENIKIIQNQLNKIIEIISKK